MVDTSHCNLNIADVQIARLAAGFDKSPFCFIPVEIVSEDSSQVYYWVIGNWRRVADVFYFYLTGDSVAARPRWLLIVREEGWWDLELQTINRRSFTITENLRLTPISHT